MKYIWMVVVIDFTVKNPQTRWLLPLSIFAIDIDGDQRPEATQRAQPTQLLPGYPGSLMRRHAGSTSLS